MMAAPKRCPECGQREGHCMDLCFNHRLGQKGRACKHDKHSRPWPEAPALLEKLRLNGPFTAMCYAAHGPHDAPCRLMTTTLCHCGRRVCPEHAPEPRP